MIDGSHSAIPYDRITSLRLQGAHTGVTPAGRDDSRSLKMLSSMSVRTTGSLGARSLTLRALFQDRRDGFCSRRFRRCIAGAGGRCSEDLSTILGAPGCQFFECDLSSLYSPVAPVSRRSVQPMKRSTDSSSSSMNVFAPTKRLPASRTRRDAAAGDGVTDDLEIGTCSSGRTPCACGPLFEIPRLGPVIARRSPRAAGAHHVSCVEGRQAP